MFDKLKKIGTAMLLSASVLPLGTNADAMSITASPSRADLLIGICDTYSNYGLSSPPFGRTVTATVGLYLPGQNSFYASGVVLQAYNRSMSLSSPNIIYSVGSGAIITQATLQSCGLTNVQMLTSSPVATSATTVQNYGDIYIRFRATEQGVQYDYDLTVTANGVTWATRTATGGSVAPQFSTAPFLQSRANQLVNNQTDLINIVNGNASNVFNAQASDGVGSFDLRLMSDTGFWAEASGSYAKFGNSKTHYAFGAMGAHISLNPNLSIGWFD